MEKPGQLNIITTQNNQIQCVIYNANYVCMKFRCGKLHDLYKELTMTKFREMKKDYAICITTRQYTLIALLEEEKSRIL